jgi:serine protease Do
MTLHPLKPAFGRSRWMAAAAAALLTGLVPAVAMASVPVAPGEMATTPRSDPRHLEQALRSVVVIGPGAPAAGPPAGSGSGFVFDADGHIITNAHVIGAARTVRVGLFDGRRVEAEVVGVDPRTDIAVVRLPAGTSVPALVMAEGPDGAPGAGSPVFALGHPLGYRFSVTSGVISGFGRSYDVVTPVDFLQHDAALNPGSSGGPLVDLEGRVLGMNTATPPETLFDIGIGLAIPVALVGEVARRLIAEGAIVRGALGLRVSHADALVTAALGAGEVEGALIDHTEPGGAAARAGLAAGDLILAIDGEPVALPREVLGRIMAHGPGDRIQLDFVRAGERRSALVTLDADRAPIVGRVGLISGMRPRGHDDLGLEVGPGRDGGGVVVTEVEMGSLAETYGLAPGDTIEAVNGLLVAEPGAFHAALGRIATGLVVFRVSRGDLGRRHISLPRSLADSASRRPGMASEQQSSLM